MKAENGPDDWGRCNQRSRPWHAKRRRGRTQHLFESRAMGGEQICRIARTVNVLVRGPVCPELRSGVRTVVPALKILVRQSASGGGASSTEMKA